MSNEYFISADRRIELSVTTVILYAALPGLFLVRLTYYGISSWKQCKNVQNMQYKMSLRRQFIIPWYKLFSYIKDSLSCEPLLKIKSFFGDRFVTFSNRCLNCLNYSELKV